jgi:MFS family permease
MAAAAPQLAVALNAQRQVQVAEDAIEAGRSPTHNDSGTSSQASASAYKKEYLLLALTFGLNHATVTTPILFASSVLTNAAGQGANAVLYGVCLLSSLFFASPLLSILGPKRGLSLSMLLYSLYVLTFAYSASLCTQRKDKACVAAEAAQMPIVLMGAVIGGFGAGLLWTCQGAFSTEVCEKIATAENKALSEVTSQVNGMWGLIFLANECAVRALTTALNVYIGFSFEITFYIWGVTASLAAMVFTLGASDLRKEQDVSSASTIPMLVRTMRGFDAKVLSVIRLWKDPKMWLLQCTTITFSFAAAWLGGYVGRNILSQALDASFIGFAGALVSGLGAVLSAVFGKVAAKVGKVPVVCVGSLAFLALAICSKWLGPKTPADWQWGALIFYAFMGTGRAVYESTNRAVMSDFFPGATKSAAAFANVFVFNGACSCLAFILGATNTDLPELYLLLAFGALTTPCLLLAYVLQRRGETE